MRIKSSSGSLQIQVLVEQIFHGYEESSIGEWTNQDISDAWKSINIVIMIAHTWMFFFSTHAAEREQERQIIFLEMWSNEQVWTAAKKVFA